MRKSQTKMPTGDVVPGRWYYWPGGTEPWRVERPFRNASYGEYFYSSGGSFRRPKSELPPYVFAAEDPNEPQPEQEPKMPKLYQTKEETARFGTLLATNSLGQLVLEMKGTGAVEAFDKTAVEEVKPYTVAIRFSSSSTTYHYLAKKGDVAVGDVLLIDGSNDFARVVKLNTKSDMARTELKGRKFITEPIGAAEPASDDEPVTE